MCRLSGLSHCLSVFCDGKVFNFHFAELPRALTVSYDSDPPLLKTVKGTF